MLLALKPHLSTEAQSPAFQVFHPPKSSAHKVLTAVWCKQV